MFEHSRSKLTRTAVVAVAAGSLLAFGGTAYAGGSDVPLMAAAVPAIALDPASGDDVVVDATPGTNPFVGGGPASGGGDFGGAGSGNGGDDVVSGNPGGSR